MLVMELQLEEEGGGAFQLSKESYAVLQKVFRGDATKQSWLQELRKNTNHT